VGVSCGDRRPSPGAGRRARESAGAGRPPSSGHAAGATGDAAGSGLLPATAPRPPRAGAPRWRALALALLVAAAAAQAPAAAPEERFREATRQLQAGDVARALATYRELAAGGAEGGSLYWNWAQGAAAKGGLGEALWALLRARELGEADAAAEREIDRLRVAANLDAAELAPEPLGAVARVARALHLDLAALALLAFSLVGHALARALPAARWPVAAAWVALAAGLACAGVALVGTRARPTAVVVRRGVPLADAASPTASALATLREGEVVPVLGASGAYLRIQDSSGARGWVTAAEVWRLDRPPAPSGER